MTNYFSMVWGGIYSLVLWLTLLVETFQVFANKASLLLNAVMFLNEKPGRSFYSFQYFTISCHFDGNL